jgi:hypothetical protein
MRRLLIAIVLDLSVVSTAANANSCATSEKTITAKGFLTGNLLRMLDDQTLGVYSVGYLDALFGGNIFGMRETCLDELQNCIGSKPISQLAAIVKKYLNDNPERWRESGHSIVYNALLRRCFFPGAK